MAFNSDTYHANRAARDSAAHLAAARDIKARAAIGEAYGWEVDRIPHHCRMAILCARIARTYRR